MDARNGIFSVVILYSFVIVVIIIVILLYHHHFCICYEHHLFSIIAMIRFVKANHVKANQYIGLFFATPQAVLTLAFAEIANSRCGSKRREEWKSMVENWRP